MSFTNIAVAQNYFYSEVENLSVRREPDLKSKRIAKLKEGERVTDLGRTSRNEISVKLRGRRTTGPFYLIRTRKGIEGWAYSRGLSNRPVYVEDYVCVVFFNEWKQFKFYGEDTTLMYFGKNCTDPDINFSFLYKTRGFREVNIKNRYGDIIGVENISRLVDKHKSGFVVLTKGEKPIFHEYTQDMDFILMCEDLDYTYGNGNCEFDTVGEYEWKYIK
jgi:hypothetical protein